MYGFTVLLIIGAYLLGSAPHLAWLARLHGSNLDGDFHIGLWQRAGKLIGVIGFLGEFAKGAIPVLVAKWLGFSPLATGLAGLAAVSGQMWPVFSRFDGEKGNSIGIGMVAALVPNATLLALVPIIVSIAIRTVPRLLKSHKFPDEQPLIGGAPSRSLPLGMATGFLVVTIASWWQGEPPAIIGCCSALFLLIIIRRLTAGLSVDLKTSRNLRAIFLNRFLYDRGIVQWRKETPSNPDTRPK